MSRISRVDFVTEPNRSISNATVASSSCYPIPSPCSGFVADTVKSEESSIPVVDEPMKTIPSRRTRSKRSLFKFPVDTGFQAKLKTSGQSSEVVKLTVEWQGASSYRQR